MNKLSVRSVSLIATACISFLILILLIVFGINIWEILIAVISISVITFIIITFIIQRYVNERLKVVYRTIHNRGNNTEVKSGDAIDRANAAAEKWDEEKVKEIEQLRKVEVYRKEFVANVTHELKTPLFNIQGYIHSLIDGALHDHEVNHIFLEKASRNVDRLVTLVSDLEIISQLETGGAIFEHEVFDIYDLVVEVFETLEFKAAAKKKYLSIEAGTEKQFYVSADKDKIRQVFVNLLENSIKYGNVNGKTWVNFIAADENLLIEICDDGPGIPEEHLLRLFERFYRVDKSRSRDAGGTGLGLAIVRHIIEGHHKTISVKSKVGEGTVFSFSLDRK